jgi:hypothetical protein
MRNKLLPALILALSFGSAAFAAHPLVSDDTGTQGSGAYSLEINGEVARYADSKVRETHSEVAAVLSAGVADNVDLVLGVPFQHLHVRESGSVDKTSGLADLSLELKWRFYEREGFSLALKPGITLPTGDDERGLGNGRVSWGGTLIATQELKLVTLHLNLGYAHNEFADDDGQRKDILSASLAATTQLTEKLQLVANVGAESNGESGNSTWPAFALAGAIWNVRENLDLDLGVKVGLNDQEADVTGLAGVVVRF